MTENRGGRGNGDLPRDRFKRAGSGVIGIIRGLRERFAVQQDRQIRKDGVKHVGKDDPVRRARFRRAGVLQHEGIGDLSVLPHHRGLHGFGDRQRGGGGHGHRGRSRQHGRAARQRSGIGDFRSFAQRRVGGDPRFIHQQGVGPGGQVQPADGQGRTVVDSQRAGWLRHAVQIEQQAVLHVRQRVLRLFFRGTGAKVVRDGQPGHIFSAVVVQTEHVSDPFTGRVILRNRRFGKRGAVCQLTRDDVGLCGKPAVAQACLILKYCHMHPPLTVAGTRVRRTRGYGSRIHSVCRKGQNDTGNQTGKNKSAPNKHVIFFTAISTTINQTPSHTNTPL